jgi:histidinol-phosphate aminotransferase
MTFNQTLDAIKVYEAGKPIELVVREFGIESKDIIKLASNENPYGCSPKVQEAVGAIVSKMALYLHAQAQGGAFKTLCRRSP